jgi:hypothetical protein
MGAGVRKNGTQNDQQSWLIAVMIEAVNTSETSVTIYWTTCLNIPVDSHIHTGLFGALGDRPAGPLSGPTLWLLTI